jgi:hypothetical protein
MVTSKTPISMVKPAADASVNSQSIGFHRHSSLTTVTGVGKFRTLQSVNSRHHRQDARQASIEVCRRWSCRKAEDDAKFVVTGIASAYLLHATGINPLPSGFVVTAQPIKAPKPPVCTDWAHEIKRDGSELSSVGTVPQCGFAMHMAGSARLAAIAAATELIKAESFTIDGEAVVLRPDGLSRFKELHRRTAAHAGILYAFDLIEHDGEDLGNLPFLDRKAALARLLNEHIAEVGATVFRPCVPAWGRGYGVGNLLSLRALLALLRRRLHRRRLGLMVCVGFGLAGAARSTRLNSFSRGPSRRSVRGRKLMILRTP